MKAVCIHALAPKGGLKDEFKIEEFRRPLPGKGQVLVKVAYAPSTSTTFGLQKEDSQYRVEP
jgi:NADPH:quinone reductase-like Zn-dependent oxidoreductase